MKNRGHTNAHVRNTSAIHVRSHVERPKSESLKTLAETIMGLISRWKTEESWQVATASHLGEHGSDQNGDRWKRVTEMGGVMRGDQE